LNKVSSLVAVGRVDLFDLHLFLFDDG